MPRADAAEWQFKPFIGGTYGGETTFLFVRETLTLPADNYAHVAIGGTALWLGEVLGVDCSRAAQWLRALEGLRVIHLAPGEVRKRGGNRSPRYHYGPD